MNIVKDYTSTYFNTFSTSVIGKEQYRTDDQKMILIIPVVNLGITKADVKVYLNNSYIVFKNISYFSINSTPYQEIGEKFELKASSSASYSVINNIKENHMQFFQIEGVAVRDLKEEYIVCNLLSENCSIIYDYEVPHYTMGILDIRANIGDLEFLNKPIDQETLALLF